MAGIAITLPAHCCQAHTMSLDAAVLKQFRMIFQSVRKHFQSIERQCGISGAQLWALARITEQPGLRVSELSAAMSVHQSTASNLVEQLFRLGLISKQRSTEDQRVVCLYPSAEGTLLIARAPQPFRGLLPETLSQLPPDELEVLHSILAKLIASMGGAADPAGADIPLAEMARTTRQQASE